jgi:hypothetical protein
MRDIYIETMKKIMFITSLVLVLLFIQSSAASAANVPYGPNWPHSVTISKIIPSWSNTNYIFTGTAIKAPDLTPAPTHGLPILTRRL